jgi:branched-chain amino acid transport system permease protein
VRERIAACVLLCAFVLVPFIASQMGSNYIITLATRIVILAFAAMSLDVLVGWAGLVSFGHAAFFGLGGYVVAVAAFHAQDGTTVLGWHGSHEALIVWPLAMVVSALAAGVIGFLSLRTRGVHFIMITLAFAQMLYFLSVALKIYGGDDGLAMSARNVIAGVKITDARTYYWLCLCLLIGLSVLMRRIVMSPFGYVLRGAKTSERRMIALGFDVMRYRLLAFILAGALAGLAGAMWANMGRFVSPDMLSWTRSGDFLVMVILGGAGTWLGPVIGAALFLVLETQLAAVTDYWQVLFGPFVICVAIYMPRGVWHFLEARRS